MGSLANVSHISIPGTKTAGEGKNFTSHNGFNFLTCLEMKLLLMCVFSDCSQEYTDSTGIDLHEFLVNTLKNNPR